MKKYKYVLGFKEVKDYLRKLKKLNNDSFTLEDFETFLFMFSGILRFLSEELSFDSDFHFFLQDLKDFENKVERMEEECQSYFSVLSDFRILVSKLEDLILEFCSVCENNGIKVDENEFIDLVLIT